MGLFNKKDKEKTPLKLEKQPSIMQDLITTFFHLVLMVGFVVFFINCIGQRVQVDGYSMETTLQDQDQLIVDCFTYRFLHAPKRQDVVVFRLQDNPNTFYVKRIIGLPGESVQIIDSVIYINGEPIEDPYATQKSFPAGAAEELITLGEDEYFVMGDNRGNSKDSREEELGPVKRSQIVGRAWMRIWPFAARTNLIPEGN